MQLWLLTVNIYSETGRKLNRTAIPNSPNKLLKRRAYTLRNRSLIDAATSGMHFRNNSKVSCSTPKIDTKSRSDVFATNRPPSADFTSPISSNWDIERKIGPPDESPKNRNDVPDEINPKMEEKRPRTASRLEADTSGGAAVARTPVRLANCDLHLHMHRRCSAVRLPEVEYNTKCPHLHGSCVLRCPKIALLGFCQAITGRCADFCDGEWFFFFSWKTMAAWLQWIVGEPSEAGRVSFLVFNRFLAWLWGWTARVLRQRSLF